VWIMQGLPYLSEAIMETDRANLEGGNGTLLIYAPA
jgi:hypothetical protein